MAVILLSRHIAFKLNPMSKGQKHPRQGSRASGGLPMYHSYAEDGHD